MSLSMSTQHIDNTRPFAPKPLPPEWLGIVGMQMFTGNFRNEADVLISWSQPAFICVSRAEQQAEIDILTDLAAENHNSPPAAELKIFPGKPTFSS